MVPKGISKRGKHTARYDRFVLYYIKDESIHSRRCAPPPLRPVWILGALRRAAVAVRVEWVGGREGRESEYASLE